MPLGHFSNNRHLFSGLGDESIASSSLAYIQLHISPGRILMNGWSY